MIRRAMAIGLVAAAVLTGACDDGGGAGPEADTVDASVAADTIEAADTATAAGDDTAPSVDTAQVTNEYPPGPYGGDYLDIADPELSFYEPWLDVDIKLRDFWGDPDVKVILISSGAGWCTACMYEAWDLVEAYDKYHDQGFEILYTLYEDPQGRALWRSHDRREADMAFMEEWRDNLGVPIGFPKRVTNYPLLVDIGYKLGEYYDKSATPFTIMVRTSDMRIVHRAVGYSQGSIDASVKTALFAN